MSGGESGKVEGNIFRFPVQHLDTAWKVGDHMEEDCDDSDSEYYTAGSDDNSDESEVVDEDGISDLDDSDRDGESDASDDEESTDDSKEMTDSSESDTCDDSEDVDGCDSSNESDSESTDDNDEHYRLWLKTRRYWKLHQRSCDDLSSKLAKMKLKEEYGREDTLRPKANQRRSICSSTTNASKTKESRRGLGGSAEGVYIYIMTDNGQRFKVGRSKHPEKRLRQLKTGNVDLKLLDSFPVCSPHAEVVAHRALEVRHRKTREWFYGAYDGIKTVVSRAIRTYTV